MAAKLPSLSLQEECEQLNLSWGSTKEKHNLGQGTFGVVTLSMEHATGCLAARKTMVVKEDFRKELVMATLLHTHPHPHALSPWAVVPDVPAVIWEFCDESLHDRWRRQAGIFGVDMIRRLMRHCLRGLDHLHRTCRVLHRDIKPSNLMLRAETSSGIVSLWVAHDPTV